MKEKKEFSAKEKADILKSYLIDKKPVSEICNEHNITENKLFSWEDKVHKNCDCAYASLYV